jgi:2-desacetyl-2-hydroxyethyl bacteriochlorophyllide A dehydrogenase
MKRQSLLFTGPEEVMLCEEKIQPPGKGEVLVRTLMSAISPGTEMLIYRGQVPKDMAVDESISALSAAAFQFPLKYGYACVGEVLECGEEVDGGWQGKRVFSFHPHESVFTASLAEIMEIPGDITLENALFLPNMETAVNFLMDGHPMIGEAVAVFGLGVVGLLTTALLADAPLSALVTFDRFSRRREEAAALGVTGCLDPEEEGVIEKALEMLQPSGYAPGADLAFELSGSPLALNQAITVTGFDGRIVIGSWYGQKVAELNLGGRFHRSRIHMMSSQVSTLRPELSGRWTKGRRMAVAWDGLRRVQPAHWITHRFPFEQASEAYRLLAQKPQEAIQVVMSYKG